MGENGAGKSTLVGILSGAIRPDSGKLFVGGRETFFSSPVDAVDEGIALVHQHFALVPAFTVEENLALARASRASHVISTFELAKPAVELASKLGWKLNPHSVTTELSVGEQQKLEILKALVGGGKVVLFDEPTATLSQEEITDLFRVMRGLANEGRVVVLIAHKLDEVMEIADRITVLRHGKVVVCDVANSETNVEQLAEWMVGTLPPGLIRVPKGEGNVVVSIKNGIVFSNQRNGINASISKGEVVGFGGVDGNGQVELAETLAGIRELISGSLEIPKRCAYIPQDRQKDGLALEMSISENLLVGNSSAASSSLGFMFPKRTFQWSKQLIDEYEIKARDGNQLASALSGGNQQKVVVARELWSRPELIVAVNPTRGLDIRATEYVHRKLLSAKEKGAAIALFSTDLDELATLADRTYFMSRGEIFEGNDSASFVGGNS